MAQLIFGTGTRGKAINAIVVYLLFFAAFGVLGSNEIVGIRPIVFGWIPAWLFGTYLLSVVFLAYTFWILGQFDEYIVGEETPSMLGKSGSGTRSALGEEEGE